MYETQNLNDLFDKDIEFANKELITVDDEVNRLVFSNNIKLKDTSNLIDDARLNLSYDHDFNQYYDLAKGKPLKDLNIKLGSAELPRFSCANHKLNLAVRHAITNHPQLKETIETLQSTISHIRRSIQTNRIFRINKCRLRLENLTRWSSAYLMLETVKRAYDNNVFNSDFICPIDLNTIELYLQILKPAYLLSISFQNSNSSIADTIPGKIKYFII